MPTLNVDVMIKGMKIAGLVAGLLTLCVMVSSVRAQTVERIIDNGTAGYSESTGDWFDSAYTGYYGTLSRANRCSPSGATASWQLTIPSSGTWSVNAQWTAGIGRVPDVKYQIYRGATLLETKTVNQQLNGGKFNLLGNYAFNSGDIAKVTILDSSGSCACPNEPCTVGADVIKFARAAGPTVIPTPTRVPTGVPTPVPTTPPTACFTVANSFSSTSFNNQTGIFTLSFDAVPSARAIDSYMGLSNSPASAATNLAAIIRFYTNGNIEARNGGAYQSQTTVPYSANLNYHFRLVVNISNHTYSAYVTPQGGSEIRIGENYAFRTEQAAVSRLNNFGGMTNTAGASVRVCSLTTSSGNITPAPTSGPTLTPNPTMTGVPGDANGDGRVDEADYAIWASYYNQTVSGRSSQGDFNGDGRVTGLDYTIWFNHYNVSSPTSTRVPPTPTNRPGVTNTPTPRTTSTPVPTVRPTTGPTVTPYPTTPPQAGLRAFPGAEGFGSTTVGGRGGRIYEISNLNDSGTGSLRECVDASGARTCIFKVGGTIRLNSSLVVMNPYITIAGQTAPGGGITLRTGTNHVDPLVDIRGHDIVIRYLTARPQITGTSSDEFDAMGIWTNNGRTDAYNIVLDHCSMSWGTDQVFGSWYGPHDFSVQWSLFAEGLSYSTHSKGRHSKGPMVGSYTDSESGSGVGARNVSFHHNLMANSEERNPLMKGGGIMDVVNNVGFNPFESGGQGSFGYIDIQAPNSVMQQNWVGNYYKSPLGVAAKPGLKTQLVGGQGLQVYVSGNVSPASSFVDSGSQQYVVSSRFSASAVTTTTAAVAYNQVSAMAGNYQGLDANGNWYTRRDAVDKRVVAGINGVNGHWGKIIDAPGATTCRGACRGGAYVLTSGDYTQFGISDPLDGDGWPIISGGTAYTDTDHDGISDTWEMAKFGNLTTASNTSDFDRDGYTDLEEFLNATNPGAAN